MKKAFPTITVIRHAKAPRLSIPAKTGENMHDDLGRIHDAPSVDDVVPGASAHMVMLDIGLSSKNYKQRRVIVVSAPEQRCIEGAVIVAQNFGLDTIHIHYGLNMNIMDSLEYGWDYHTMNMHLTPQQMNRVVDAKNVGVELKVRIASRLGAPLTAEARFENLTDSMNRIKAAIEDCRSSLEYEGDSVVIVGHDDTLQGLVENYGQDVRIEGKPRDGAFITFATQSRGRVWLIGRGGVEMVPSV
jgi:broad specificity phosphatase PhoE